jgi:hypothetical protein
VIGSGGKDNDFKQIAKNLSVTIDKIGIENLTIDDVITPADNFDTNKSP